MYKKVDNNHIDLVPISTIKMELLGNQPIRVEHNASKVYLKLVFSIFQLND